MSQIAAAEHLAGILPGLLGREVASICKIFGGRNSAVFKVLCREGSAFAAKQYFKEPLDRRNRLEAEFNGLRYLRDKGLDMVPEPVAADQANRVAVFEFVEGERIAPAAVLPGDIDQALGFVAALARLARELDSAAIRDASEACFSPRDVSDNIANRLGQLTSIPGDEPRTMGLARFLHQDFIPALERIGLWCRKECARRGLDFEAPIPRALQTLSPSDFGFHNALKRPDGRLVFLDFEYFGWDDPVKMACDFVQHPGTSLSDDCKRRFATGTTAIFAADPTFLDRVACIHPLIGLTWCLIVLNEFIPDSFLRRGFAAGESLPRDEVLHTQLHKAKTMFKRVVDNYAHFPYLD